MEYEVRFYYPISSLDNIINNLDRINELKKEGRKHEKTMQFNHCDERYNFYDDSIDGRFRVRMSKDDNDANCKLSWKRRLKDTFDTNINKEEEVELNVNYDESENLMFLVNNVLHFNIVESYERYRTVYCNDDIEIAVDEYPFGIALEIESKGENKNPEATINYWVDKLGLDINKSYRLSWDDKYQELCEEQSVPMFKEVLFGKQMPTVK